MENKKHINMYNAIKKLLLALPFILVIGVSRQWDNDTYWIVKTGEHIVNNGIPTKDFLTMHTNMDLVVQQWLSDVIFYKLYAWFGVAGPIILASVMYIIILLLIYKLHNLLNTGKLMQAISATCSAVILFSFAVTRPQIFSYAIILTEIICLESFVKNGKWQYLIPLPFLAVLEVNLHASMFTMLFIIMMPYIANSLPLKIKGKIISCCKLLPLIITAAAMIVGGFLTPYGIKGMSFIFTTSIGDKVNSDISELEPITLSKDNLLFLIAIIFVIVCYCIYLKKSKSAAPLRYHLLIIGTLIMALAYKKLFPYFLIAGVTTASSLIQNYKIPIREKFKDKKFSRVIGSEIFIAIIVIFTVAITVTHYSFINSDNIVNDQTEKEYIEKFDRALSVLNNEDKNTMVLYNGFNTGAYLEFNDYTTYIDPRADSFVIEANHDFDYLTEYTNFKNGTLYYKNFAKKYNFTHFFIDKGTESAVYTLLKNDGDYTLLYENDEFAIFKTIR